ncbi:dynein axonemal heavy chain 17-like [Symphorus nematophorus]
MFWKNRLKNLKFIQEQLMSSRGQQVASIVQRTDSVYWATLRDIYRDVQEGVMEAEDVTLSLSPLQEKLEELQQVEYEQLGANMAAMMEEIRLIWIRSEFYCRGCRMVVLLQEICNLFIHTSRKFLCGQEVMRGLVSRPARVLDDVKLVIRTLQTLKEVYSQCRTQLEDQSQDGRRHSWDFPSHLAFVHLDNFLTCVDSIQEALCVVLQLLQLDRAVLSGVSSRMWTEVVQDIYQDFLGHVTVLSSSNCDPTDPDDQSFQLHLDQFTAQVSHLERRLVCVLSRALKDCYTSSSAAELLQMFRFVLGRPLIRDLLRPQLIQLVDMVLRELDETELLFYTQRQKPETSNRFSPSAATRLRWTQELQQRAEDAVDSYRTVHEMYPESGESQLVLQRFEQVVDVLQDFRDQVRTDWSHQLDSDCGFVLEQPLIQQEEQGMLGVPCSHKLEDVLRELRYASREPDVQLRPLTARLFACRDDIRQTYLCLGHMVSCYNQVLRDVLQVELPLIQDQLQDLNQSLSELQETSWSCADVQRLVEQQRHKVLKFHSTVSEARDNMVAMTTIIQGWAELHLLRRSGDSLLEGGATEQSYRRIREEGQQLLRLTQANRRLYGADASSESWIRYLDHVDQQVEDGLFQLLLRSLNFLCDNMKPQSCSVLFSVRLQLQETGSVFEPSVGVGLCDIIKNIISDVYSAASLPPRISESHHGNYQVSLQQSPVLCVLEQEVMRCLQQVSAEAELVRAGLDRYSSLWQRNKTDMMQEFLSYSRQLGPDELDADEAPPTLTDFQREIETLRALSRDVSRLDDVITVHGWLQVDVRPFRDALISLIHDWTHLYTQHLVDSVRDSLLQVTQRADNNDNEESPSSSRLPLTDTIVLLEAAGVQLPEHLAAQLQVSQCSATVAETDGAFRTVV